MKFATNVMNGLAMIAKKTMFHCADSVAKTFRVQTILPMKAKRKHLKKKIVSLVYHGGYVCGVKEAGKINLGDKEVLQCPSCGSTNTPRSLSGA